ncbi:uncharacterized protein LOC125675093 isoform X2 [Ostrea edulis]|uniref:uncharacterized protein LOC125675093 isoform X2 n=1 Tax=Ostrea edulis TaxID=37623 RepID=UPI0024AFB155|nr:uncharacterized protein LOC125675093 isoform X2 [Ostrea edulis]
MIQLQGIGSRRAQRNLSMSSESWVDTLNGRWTPLLFLVLGIIAFFVPLWFSPLECMFPAEFSTQEIAYGKSRCYEATRIRNFPHRGLSENLHFKPPEVTTANRDSEGQRTLYQFVEANLMKRELEISTQMLTDQQIWKFANNTLGEDVIAFLQQMQANNNGCVVMETVTELWKIYHGGVQSSPMGNPLLPEASCPGQTFQASRPGVELQHIDRGPGVPEGYTAQGQVTAQQSIYPAYPATVYKT